MDNFKEFSPFKAEVFSEKTLFELLLTKNEKKNEYSLQLTKSLDTTYWEIKFSLQELQESNPVWHHFYDEVYFQETICQIITEKKIKIKIQNNEMNIIFSIEGKLGEKIIIFDFPMILIKKENDLKETVEKVSEYVRNLDEKMDKSLKNLETNFVQMKNLFETNMKDVMNNSLKDYEKKFEGQIKAEIDQLQEFRIKLFKDVSLFKLWENPADGNSNKKLEILYSPFLNQNNDGYHTFSNSNYTIQKTSANAWFGFKCQNINKIGKYAFSIKIDIFSANNLIIGFCTSDTNQSSGVHPKNTSFMFHLNNGSFYHRGANSQAGYGLTMKVNDIYTVVINLYTKAMILYLNGEVCSFSKSIDIKDEEINNLCPVVDFYAANTISIVNFDKINY